MPSGDEQSPDYGDPELTLRRTVVGCSPWSLLYAWDIEKRNRNLKVPYNFTSTGKMLVESKADMKKRGLRSPDLADAFLLTFAGAERRKVERYRKPEPRNYSAWAV